MTATVGFLVTAMVMTSDSGDFASELDFGRSILSFSGGWNWVVVMKKISSRNATSTMGVMSIAMPMRRFFLSMAGRRLPYFFSEAEAARSWSTSYDASSIM